MNTKKPNARTLSLTAALVATLTLAACGGGGGASTSSDSGAEQPAAANVTPMSSLVVPDSMTWSTANNQQLDVSVVDASGQPVIDAGVTLSTVLRSNPHDATPLSRPVAMDRIDQASTSASGKAALSARVPAHLGEVMLEASKGETSARQVIAVADLTKALTLKLE